jgi:hypothetical protein
MCSEIHGVKNICICFKFILIKSKVELVLLEGAGVGFLHGKTVTGFLYYSDFQFVAILDQVISPYDCVAMSLSIYYIVSSTMQLSSSVRT